MIRKVKMKIYKRLLKNECIKILNLRGWNNKNQVDFRSPESMMRYLHFYEVVSDAELKNFLNRKA